MNARACCTERSQVRVLCESPSDFKSTVSTDSVLVLEQRAVGLGLAIARVVTMSELAGYCPTWCVCVQTRYAARKSSCPFSAFPLRLQLFLRPQLCAGCCANLLLWLHTICGVAKRELRKMHGTFFSRWSEKLERRPWEQKVHAAIKVKAVYAAMRRCSKNVGQEGWAPFSQRTLAPGCSRNGGGPMFSSGANLAMEIAAAMSVPRVRTCEPCLNNDECIAGSGQNVYNALRSAIPRCKTPGDHRGDGLVVVGWLARSPPHFIAHTMC